MEKGRWGLKLEEEEIAYFCHIKLFNREFSTIPAGYEESRERISKGGKWEFTLLYGFSTSFLASLGSVA